MTLKKLNLANLPTPIWHSPKLDEIVGAQVWVKRDDMTAGAEAGNKIRKLEYLLADAMQKGATTVFTCGALQSNHARVTALLARGLGMRTVLFLFMTEQPPSPADRGNAFLDRMADAEIRLITLEQYLERTELMEEEARILQSQGERVYIIPEGGSNGLGALGYVDAMQEVRSQLDQGQADGPGPFDAVAHACGSGGTAAGLRLGAAKWDVAQSTLSFAVAADKSYFQELIDRITAEARQIRKGLDQSNQLQIFDQWTGPGYGVPSREQTEFIVRVSRTTGLILDPVYTGKAMYGLAQMENKPKRVLFIHTGGLPGLLAQAEEFDRVIGDGTVPTC